MRSEVDSTGQPGSPRVASPRLLVSVRSAEEAREALAGGAGIIDIKEPADGSLGAALPGVRAEIVREVAGGAPVTAALGELQSLGAEWALEHHQGISLYKLGLSETRQSDWRTMLDEARIRIREGSEGEADLVVVAYADCRRAVSPEPSSLLEYAIDHGFSHFLVDTFDKTAGGLSEFFEWGELGDLCERARRGGLCFVAAGSLGAEQLGAVAAAGVDVIAVRGAATAGVRTAAIDRQAVSGLIAGIRAALSPG